MTKRIERLLRGALAAMLAAMALGAGAQSAPRLPPGVTWQPMHSFTVNANPSYISNATEEEGKLLKLVWAKELSQVGPAADGLPGSSSFVVGSSPQGITGRLLFSIMTRDPYKICDPGPMGSEASNHLYWNCPLRVSLFGSDGSYKFKDFPDYCIMFAQTNEPGTPHWPQNHNEFAYDPQQGFAYFRLIQFGKVVPECNRTIHIGKV